MIPQTAAQINGPQMGFCSAPKTGGFGSLPNRQPASLISAFQRFIDYEAYFVKMWFDECAREGHAGSELQKRYQARYNELVLLREKITGPEFLLQFLDREKFDMPAATERIFIKELCKPNPVPQPG